MATLVFDLKAQGHDFKHAPHRGAIWYECKSCPMLASLGDILDLSSGRARFPCSPAVLDPAAITRLAKEIADDLEWSKSQEVEAKSRCECGALKAMGCGNGMPGHSAWCPWAAQ